MAEPSPLKSGQTNIATNGGVSAATGLAAYGVFADGAGASIQLAGAAIATTGDEATGLYAGLYQSEAATGGAIVVSGPLSVTTSGSEAYGAWAQSPGSTIALQGPSTFTINGSAFGLNATEGGVITSSDLVAITVNGSGGGGVEVANAGSAITLNGTTNVALNGSANYGLYALDGGALALQGPTSVAVNGGGSAGVVASSAAITASGALNVTTAQTTSYGFLLTGSSPSITATGGGTVMTAGSALTFVDATNATATFNNFTFNAIAGDLIFADPSTATVNFNNTVANAGANNLLNATQGSAFTLNANASNLTGAIQTDSTSSTNVNLTNRHALDDDRIFLRLEPRRHEQRRRLRAAQRQRVQNADRQQLDRLGGDPDHERHARRREFNLRPSRRQRRQGERRDRADHQQRRRRRGPDNRIRHPAHFGGQRRQHSTRMLSH